MATFHDPVLAKSMIMEHGYTKLVAFDLTGNEPIYRVQDKTPEAICDALDALLASQDEGFRVEVGKAGDASEKGARPTPWRKPMAWRFRAEAKPSPAPNVVHQPAATAIPAGYVHKTEHEMLLRLSKLEAELVVAKNSHRCVHGFLPTEPCEVCDAEEDDEEEENTDQWITTVERLLDKYAKPTTVPKKELPITGVGGEDAEIWSAICQMRKDYPKEFDEYKEKLLSQYRTAE